MHRTTTTAATKGSIKHHYQPLDLAPLAPLPQAQRIRVLDQEDGGHHYHCVLKRVQESDDDTNPSTSSVPPSSCSYVIHHLLYQHPNSGAVLLVATATTTKKALSSSPLPPLSPPSTAALVGGSDHQLVVIKAMPRLHDSSIINTGHRHRGDDPLREVGALQILQAQHHHHHHHHLPTPHVIPLLDCMQDHDYIYVVMPYLTGNDLFTRVEGTNGEGLSEAQAAHYIGQMAEGLLFMKEICNLAHHDVSLENAMVVEEEEEEGGKEVVQLIDLGMCLQVPPPPLSLSDGHRPVHISPQRCSGKPCYVAPEVFWEVAFDPFAADIWSLGVCLYIMLTARPLYQSPHDVAFKLLSFPGRGLDEVLACYATHGVKQLSPRARDLLGRMLHPQPSHRPTLQEVLNHPLLLNHHPHHRKQEH